MVFNPGAKVGEVFVDVVLKSELPRELAKEIAKAQAAAPPIKVEVDTAYFDKQFSSIVSAINGTKATIQVQADTGLAKAKIAEITNRDHRAQIKADLDTTAAKLKIEMLKRELKGVGRSGGGISLGSLFSGGGSGLAELGGMSFAAARLGGMFAAAVSAAAPLVPILSAAAGAALSLGNAISVAGAATGVLALAFSGIGGALKAMSNVQMKGAREAVNTGAAARAAASAVASARSALARATENAAEAIKNALKGIERAERDLADAQKEAAEATKAISEARKQAAEDIEDYQLKLRGLAIDERKAVAEVEKARKRLALAKSFGDIPQSIIDRLQLAYDDQVHSLDEIQESQEDTQLAYDDAAAKGVEGSDLVVEAKEREAEANQAVLDSQEGLADAYEKMAKAQRDGARDIADAQRNLQDALARVGEAAQNASASVDALDDAMSKLGPAGQKFVRFLFSLRGYYKKLKESAEAGIFAGLEDGIRAMLPMFDHLDETVRIISGTMGDFFSKIGHFIAGGVGDRFLDLLQRMAPPLFESLLRIVEAMADAWVTIGEKTEGLTLDVANGLAGLAESFDRFVNSPSFDEFIAMFRADLPKVMGAIGAVFRAIGALALAFRPVGLELIQMITNLANSIANADEQKLERIVNTLVKLSLAGAGLWVVFSALRAIMSMFSIASSLVAVLTNPWFLLAAAIAAVGFVIWDVAANGGENVKKIGEFFSKGVEWIKNEGWPKLRDGLKEMGTKILDWWGGEGGDKFREGVINALDKAARWLLTEAPQKVADWLYDVGQKIYEWWTDDSPDSGASKFRAGVKDAWNKMITWLGDNLAEYAHDFGTWLGDAITAGITWVNDNPDKIVSWIGTVITNILKLSLVINFVMTEIVVSFFFGLIKGGFEGFRKKASEIGWTEALFGFGLDMMGGLGAGIRAGVSNLVSVLNWIISIVNIGIGLVEKFGKVFDDDFSVGRIPKIPTQSDRDAANFSGGAFASSGGGQNRPTGGVGGSAPRTGAWNDDDNDESNASWLWRHTPTGYVFNKGVNWTQKKIQDGLEAILGTATKPLTSNPGKLMRGATLKTAKPIADVLFGRQNEQDAEAGTQSAPQFFNGGMIFNRHYGVTQSYAKHGYAMDIGTPVGTPIYAPWAGTLRNSSYTKGGQFVSYGRLLDVAGGNGLNFRVAHLSQFVPGGSVRAGQLVGFTGNVGNSRGPHAHVEVKANGQFVNPGNYLKYDIGGILRHGGGAVNLSGKPEAILTYDQWQTLEKVAKSPMLTSVTNNRTGPAVVIENFNASDKVDMEAFMQFAEFYVRAGRV